MPKKTFVIRLTDEEIQRVETMRGDLKPTTFLQRLVSDTLLNKLDSYASTLEKIGAEERQNKAALTAILSKLDSLQKQTTAPTTAAGKMPEQIALKDFREIQTKLDSIIKYTCENDITRKHILSFRNAFSIFAELSIDNITELKKADISESEKNEMTRTFQNVKI